MLDMIDIDGTPPGGMNLLGEPVSETDRLTEWRERLGRAGQEVESGRRGADHISKMHTALLCTTISVT
jgi:hypothetical protein